MLRLVNIKNENGVIRADFFPEQENKSRHIVVNADNGEILEVENGEGYNYMYPAHAAQTLYEMAQNNDNRTERIVMWF